MGIRRVWIQLDGSAELLFGARPVPLEMLLDESKGSVCFSKRAVDIQRLHCCSFRLWPGIGGCQIAVIAHKTVSVCKARISQSVLRIFLNCLCEKVRCGLEIPGRSLIPIKKSLQVELVGLRVFRRAFREQLLLFAH